MTPSLSINVCPQVSRALQIKSQYLSKTFGDLESKRKEAEQVVESGVLGLGLLGSHAEEAEKSV